MRIPKKLSVLTALLAVSGALAAEPLRLDPAGAARLALSRNLELQAARQVLNEAAARARGAGRLANPELGLEVAGGRDFEGRVEVGLTQWFPVTARLRWERRLSELELAMARCEVAGRELDIAAAAQTALVDLAAAREAVQLAFRQSGVAKTEAETLRKQAEEGFVSRTEAGSTALAVDEIGVQGVAMQADESLAAAKLATVLGLSAEENFVVQNLALPTALPGKISPPPRPDLQLAELALEAGDADVQVARASRWQDIGVGIFAEGERNRDEPEGIEPEGLLGMRATVPLPIWQDGRARVEEKKAGRARRERHLAALRLAIQNETSAAWRAMKIRYEAARKSEAEILPAARKNLADYEAARARGEADAAQVFRARERLAGLERADIEARKAFFLARIQWLHATGTLLSQP
jgi:cobalt-zinc-cadmium efflux system outer membrane protein